MNDERKGSLKKLIKKKTQKCQTVHKGNLNVVSVFCPRGQKEEIIIKVIKFSPLIPYRNIWKLVWKNCICIVWLNGLISG